MNKKTIWAAAKNLLSIAKRANIDMGSEFILACEPVLIVELIGAASQDVNFVSEASEMEDLLLKAKNAVGKKLIEDDGFCFVEACEPRLIEIICSKIIEQYGSESIPA